MFGDEMSILGSNLLTRSDSDVPAAMKRQSPRKLQLFNLPDLLALQSPTAPQEVESVQEKSSSPWFTRTPASQLSQDSRVTQNSGSQNSKIGSVKSLSEPSDTLRSRQPSFHSEVPSIKQVSFDNQRSSQRMDDLDIFGFGESSSKNTEKIFEMGKTERSLLSDCRGCD